MKSKFDIIFEKQMALLQEGGNAVEGVSKIKRENIPATIQKIYDEVLKPVGVTEDAYTSEIGSAGKKAFSGDLDIAINWNKVAELTGKTVNELKQETRDQLKKMKYDFVETGGNFNTKIPIQGDQEGEFVQCDFIPTTNIPFLKFRFFSPTEEQSKYKSIHRNTLLSDIIKTLTMQAADEAKNEGEYISQDGHHYPASTFKHVSFSLDGFYETVKSFVGPRGFRKNAAKDPSRSKFITDNPEEFFDMLFGKGKVTREDVESFESIWNKILMTDKVPEECRAKIIKETYMGYKNSGVVIPTEMIKWLEENDPAFLEQNK